MPHAPHGFSVIELVVITGLVGLLGSFTVPRVWRAAEYLRYRSAVDAVASLVRVSRHHALMQREPVELRVDAARGMFALVEFDARTIRTERVERTVWLPAGLEVADAPTTLRIPPSGDVPTADIVISAPAYHRNFRIITHRTGSVELHEEPLL